jgi:hypothetical protein
MSVPGRRQHPALSVEGDSKRVADDLVMTSPKRHRQHPTWPANTPAAQLSCCPGRNLLSRCGGDHDRRSRRGGPVSRRWQSWRARTWAGGCPGPTPGPARGGANSTAPLAIEMLAATEAPEARHDEDRQTRTARSSVAARTGYPVLERRCAGATHCRLRTERTDERISHTAPRPTVTLRHVVRNPLGRPRPSLPETFSSIWQYGQVVTSYLRKCHL